MPRLLTMIVAICLLTTAPCIAGNQVLRHYTGSLNINTSSAADFTQLPGIGEVTAYRIVKARETRGPFKEKKELLGIKGISKSVYAGIVSHVSISGDNTLKVRLDINSATRSLLMGLPGATVDEAGSIISYRASKGTIKDIDELKKVPGMTEKRFSELLDLVAVSPKHSL